MLRDKLKDGILNRIADVSINGSLEHRLPHNLNISFAHVDGESLLMGLNDMAVSSGSACTTDLPEPSHVLQALGVKNQLAHSSLRFGLGRFNTEEEDRLRNRQGCRGRLPPARAVATRAGRTNLVTVGCFPAQNTRSARGGERKMGTATNSLQAKCPKFLGSLSGERIGWQSPFFATFNSTTGC